jgi:hypothetical protein
MHTKIWPLKIYITTRINDPKNETDCTNEEISQNQDWGEEFVVLKPYNDWRENQHCCKSKWK